jgi:dihydropteroate synthase
MRLQTNALHPVKLGSLLLDFSKKTYIMGILNCTPDSFYPASRLVTFHTAIEGARDMIEAGVDIIDIGGESSRPGAEPVPVEEELKRVIPLIEAIRQESDILISIDTTKSLVAELALAAGANIINDISGLRNDSRMGLVVSKSKAPVVLMHMRGTPKTMQQEPYYQDVIGEIKDELNQLINKALAMGIERQQIIIDPGIGFGKRLEDNIRILKEFAAFTSFHLPLLIGVSRKSFLGHILNKPVEDRLIATVVANTLAVLNGANFVRVHDYREAIDMAKIIDTIGQAG